MNPTTGPTNFVRDIILEDLKTNKYGGRVHTRFRPKPNGYLHIGHAKSICLNFGLAAEFGGKTNLRFDDTNPCKEETEYVDSIIDNVHWLGFDWEDRCFYASDYFDQLYEWAVQLIKAGKAYVCDLTGDEVRSIAAPSPSPAKRALTATVRWKRTSICSNACAPASSRTAHDAARQNRHGLRQLNMPRSHHVPHPACRPSPHRRQVVHLPDVRLRPGQSDSMERITHSIARWNSRTTARSTIGMSSSWASTLRSRSSSTGSTSPHAAEQAEAAHPGSGWDT